MVKWSVCLKKEVNYQITLFHVLDFALSVLLEKYLSPKITYPCNYH